MKIDPKNKIDEPLVMINVGWQEETRYYYYADALGSIRFLTNANGEIVESYSYDTFGDRCNRLSSLLDLSI